MPVLFIMKLNKRKSPDVFPGEGGRSSASAARWEPVTLPHTWNAEDGQDGGNDYYQLGTAADKETSDQLGKGEKENG